MRDVISSAVVGDDVYGDDPTVNSLEERVAGLFGKEAGLFCPTGSLANQLLIRQLVKPGDELLTEERAHIVRAELGAGAVFSGITTRTWSSERGLLNAQTPLALAHENAGPYLVSTAAIAVENTHNFGGGTVQPISEIEKLSRQACERGIAMHLDGARQILQSVGLDESALVNTPDLPLDEKEAEQAMRNGVQRSSLLQNCSGKHSGMIATCVAAGWATDGYLHVEHPLQQAITNGIPTLAEDPVLGIGIDGCGAPAHVVSLVGLARSFRNMAIGAAGEAGLRIHRAMTSFPDMVGGPDRDVSLLMRGIPGLMAKDGAEGVFVAALPDGRAIALKVADGANRPRPPLMRAALQALGVDISQVRPDAFESTILGHGSRVGEVRIVGELARLSRAS
jgi:L-asparaginase II